MKYCGKCKLTKEKTDFGKRKASADGLAAMCKLCQKEYDRARFLDDEDIVITSKKFGAVAKAVAANLQAQLDGGKGKKK